MERLSFERAYAGEFFCFCASVEVCAVIASLAVTFDLLAFAHHLVGFTLLLQGVAAAVVGCWSCLRHHRLTRGNTASANVKIGLKMLVNPPPSEWVGLLVGLGVGVAALPVYGRYLPGAAGELPVVLQLGISATVSAAALQVVQLRRRRIEAREQALVQRLHHHFLFSTLNTTAYLIGRDSEAAAHMLNDLSELFRAMLRQEPMTTLAEETEFTRRYIRAERKRLENRLGVEWRVPDVEQMRVRVPTMMLQPLIENAIYHGIETREEGGIIRVSIEVRNNRVFFNICNPVGDVTPDDHTQGSHIAQKSVRERLFLAYGTACCFFYERHHGEYRVVISIPKQEVR